MIIRVAQFDFAANLRWRSGVKKVDKDVIGKLFDNFTSFGTRLYSAAGFDGVGVVESENDVIEIEAREKVYSLAEAAAGYKSNAIFLTKVVAGSDLKYWCSLISNGVPHIDWASDSIDGCLGPVVKRLDELEGDGLLTAPNCSFVVDEEITDDDLEDSVKFEEILLKRNGLVKTRLSIGDLITTKGDPLTGLNSGVNIGSFNVNQIAKVSLALFLIVASVLLFTEEDDPYAELAEKYAYQPVVVTDHSESVTRDVNMFLSGSDPAWIERAWSIYNKWPRLITPFANSRFYCVLNKTLQCEIGYIREDTNTPAVAAFNHLLTIDGNIRPNHDLSVLSLEISEHLNLKKKTLSALDNLRDLNSVIKLGDRVNLSGSSRINLNEVLTVSIGGRNPYFSSLSNEVQQKLTVNGITFTASGEYQSDLINFIEVARENNLVVFDSLKLQGIYPIAWEISGTFMIKGNKTNENS